MAFDFMGKIREAKNESMLDIAKLEAFVEEISKTYEKPIQVRVIQSEKSPRDLLVKSKISVSSYPGSHMEDLNNAVKAFRFYLEELARTVDGEVNKTEGFYNNDKTFFSLY